MKKRERIIFIENSGGYSGAEKVNIEIMKNLKDQYEFYYASERGVIVDYLSEQDIQHIEITKVCIKEIQRIEREYEPSLFHATDYNVSVICALAGIRIPFISHLHNNPPWLKKLHPYSFAYLIAGRKAAKILTVSDSIKKEYIFSKMIEKKMKNIANPISREDILNHRSCDANKAYDICFTGRFTEEKNPFLFLEIIHKLREKFPFLSVVMIGDGELRAEIEKRIHKMGLDRCITLVGFQKNPYVFMDKSKILLLPSRYEGYGLVAFEALTLGLPCVVANVGGLPGIVTKKCGFLCECQKDYLQGLEILMNNKEIYTRYSNEAQKRAEELENIDEYMKSISEIYEAILKNRR